MKTQNQPEEKSYTHLLFITCVLLVLGTMWLQEARVQKYYDLHQNAVLVQKRQIQRIQQLEQENSLLYDVITSSRP